MAEVFRAKSFGVEGFERFVAVKRILASMAEDQDFIRMFIDEARIASHLTHQNIVQIYEFGKHEGLYFISMEYVGGRDLRAILDRQKKLRRPMDPAMACFVITKVAEALDYAHRKRDPTGKELKIIHRDVSPQNVILSFEGEIKLCDFGIAKAVTQSTRTQVGVLKGKFAYMSPEQVRGRPIDRRSDIFALGGVFYEMLTGERLFLGETDYATLEAVRSARVQPPRTFVPDLPARLEEIVLRMLTREPDQRYQWATEVLEDLYRYLVGAGKVYHPHHLRQFMQEAYAEDIEEENAKLESFLPLRLEEEDGEETQLRPAHEKSTSEILRSLGLAPKDPDPGDGEGEDQDEKTSEDYLPTMGPDANPSLDEVLVAPAPSDQHDFHGDRLVAHDDMAATLMADEDDGGERTIEGQETNLRAEIQAAQAAMAEAMDGATVDGIERDELELEGARTTLDDPAEGPKMAAELRRPRQRELSETHIPEPRAREPEPRAREPEPPIFPSVPPTAVRPRNEESRRAPALLAPNRNPIEKSQTGSSALPQRSHPQTGAVPVPRPTPPPPAPALVLPLPGPVAKDPPPAAAAASRVAPRSKPPPKDPKVVIAAAATLVLALIVLFFVIALANRPAGAGLRIDTQPTTEVEILLDGNLVAVAAPVDLEGLALGDHTIEVRAKGYLVYRQAFPLNEPRPHTLTIPLTPAPPAAAPTN